MDKVCVLGAGQMGSGISQVVASAGYPVTMIDVSQEALDAIFAVREIGEAQLVACLAAHAIDAEAYRVAECYGSGRILGADPLGGNPIFRIPVPAA